MYTGVALSVYRSFIIVRVVYPTGTTGPQKPLSAGTTLADGLLLRMATLTAGPVMEAGQLCYDMTLLRLIFSEVFASLALGEL